MDRDLDRRARAAGHPLVVRRVAELLAARWDPAQEFVAPDGGHGAAAHAAAVLGIYAAGGSLAEVMGYLRRAEEAVLALARTTGEQRAALAQAALEIALAVPGVGPTESPQAT